MYFRNLVTSAVVLLLCAQYLLSTDWDGKYELIENWRFSDEIISGYTWDAYLDNEGNLILMFFKDGIKIVNSQEIKNLAKMGQGPGELERWVALFFDGKYLIDIEGSGKIIYYERIDNQYLYKETKWLKRGVGFPFIKGAVKSNNNWYITGFSQKSEGGSNTVCGYFLHVFGENGDLEKRLFYKDFRGRYRGPFLLTSYIRMFKDKIWVMLASDPELRIFNINDDTLIRAINLKMPRFYKPIKDYIPYEIYSLDTLKKIYEEWMLSYSRIENFIITENHLIVQIRTASENLPTFALCFYDLETLFLEDYYFCNHLLLAEQNGHFYFYENGDPGLDEKATKFSIRIYKQRQNASEK